MCSRRVRDNERLVLLLDSAAAESLPVDFTSKLIARLEAEQRTSGAVQAVPAKRRMILRPEIVNIMVAAAATYLFVTSGALKVVVALDQASLEIHVFSRLGTAFQVVGQWFGSFN